MQVPVSKRTLLRGFMSGAVVLFGTTACSRSDRAESGSDNTAATTLDTTVARATQDVAGAGQDRVAPDTTRPAGENMGTGASAGDTAPARLQSDAPRAATASPSGEKHDTSVAAESGAAGYRAMERDTAAQPESDSARVTEDTSDMSLNQADTTNVEVAVTAGVDTSAADTSAGVAVGADVGDTTINAGRVRPIEDSTETMGQVTTGTGNGGVSSDSAEAAGEGAIAARGADTTGNAGRIRPPEDSTEMQGNVSSAESAGVNAADTADEAPVAETEVATETRTEPVVGAAAMGGTVTGADAVAMMTRQGEQCNVVDPESDQEVRWDMSSTPATLNPCGLGSMNLSKVWTASQR